MTKERVSHHSPQRQRAVSGYLVRDEHARPERRHETDERHASAESNHLAAGAPADSARSSLCVGSRCRIWRVQNRIVTTTVLQRGEVNRAATPTVDARTCPEPQRDADLPEHGQVQPDRAKRGMACHPKLVQRQDRPTFALVALRWASFAYTHERRLVDQNSAIWNQVAVLLSRIDALRLGA